jgi:glycosyltransferase involved in cell wall biosynthesis
MVFLDYWLYEKKIKIWSYLKSFFSFSHRKDDIDFRDLSIKSVLGKNDVDKDYDVLIPTLGRATYLEDVLHDLANQSTLPAKVILIEQNADINASTELNYIYDKDWPFEIDHMLINRLGACNARNIALSKVSSSWVFFADDDIRITTDLVEKAFEFIYQYGVSAVTLASLMEGESLIQKIPIQWHTFSTNSSFVNSNALQGITFGLEHEFGFGEDSDFGMKLRNKGHDVIFYPSTDILHLKAPIGGFRSKVLHPWNNDEISPKPSPMVMAHKLKHVTKEQLLGYRTTMFIKNYRLSEKINPFSYYSIMAKKWDKSILWAQELIRKHNPNGV